MLRLTLNIMPFIFHVSDCRTKCIYYRLVYNLGMKPEIYCVYLLIQWSKFESVTNNLTIVYILKFLSQVHARTECQRDREYHAT